jgi:hypothetical protein
VLAVPPEHHRAEGSTEMPRKLVRSFALLAVVVLEVGVLET